MRWVRLGRLPHTKSVELLDGASRERSSTLTLLHWSYYSVRTLIVCVGDD